MVKHSPDFESISAIEEELLVARLASARHAIEHAGEKGRALEHVVMKLLREFLPAEYGLSSGFIAYHTPDGPKLSPQLDVIIYNALSGGPIVRLDTCDVLPLESVYAYVEVKASMRSSNSAPDDSIEGCLKRNFELRKMTKRLYWTPSSEHTMVNQVNEFNWLPIRSYVFAFEPRGKVAKTLSLFAQQIANFSSSLGDPTHLHGVFVANHGFLETVPIIKAQAKPGDRFNVQYTKKHALLALKRSLLLQLSRFPKAQPEWSPAIEMYYSKLEWTTTAPSVA